MFLIAVSRAVLHSAVTGLERSTFEVDGLQVTVLRDPRRIELTETEGGFVLVNAPLGRGGGEEAEFTRITLDRGERALLLRSTPRSNASVYHASHGDGAFTCASHVRLLRAAGVEIAEDPARVPELFRYRQVLPPFTLFKGIHQLHRARLRVELRAGRCHPGPEQGYEPFPEETPASLPAGRIEGASRACAERALAVIETAMGDLEARRGEVAVPLSGGMDSSCLFRIAQRRLGLEESFSGGYPFESSADNRERRYALSAAAALGSRHRYHEPTLHEYLECVIRAIDAAEEPIHHMQTAVIHSLLRSGLPRESRIVVTGIGAGGVFGSPLHKLVRDLRRHPLFYGVLASAPVGSVLRQVARSTGRAIRLNKAIGLRARLALPDTHDDSPLWSMDSYGNLTWIRRYFGVEERETRHTRSRMLAPFAERSLYDRLALIDLSDKAGLIYAKLAAESGRTLWHPFFEQSLQHAMRSFPWEVHLCTNKNVLATMSRALGVPEFILTRPKSGFGVRQNEWARPGGALEPLVAVAAKGFDPGEMRAMQSTDPERARTLWIMLNYGIWRRLHVANEPLERLLDELFETREPLAAREPVAAS